MRDTGSIVHAFCNLKAVTVYSQTENAEFYVIMFCVFIQGGF